MAEGLVFFVEDDAAVVDAAPIRRYFEDGGVTVGPPGTPALGRQGFCFDRGRGAVGGGRTVHESVHSGTHFAAARRGGTGHGDLLTRGRTGRWW